MIWLKNLKIGTRIGLGFTVIIIFMLLIGYGGFFGVNTVKYDLNDIYETRFPSLDYLIEADRDLQQLLVAERSMIFADANSEVFRRLLQDYEQNLKQSEERIGKYADLSITPEERKIILEYESAAKEWKEVSRRVLEARMADTPESRREATDLTLGEAEKKFEEMREYIDTLTELVLKLAREAHQNAESMYDRTIYTLIGIIGVGLLVGVVLMWLMNRAVTRPLRAAIEGLTGISMQVASASGEVASSSQQLAEGSSEQAASLEQTSASLEEMSSMTRHNANNAGNADGLMKGAQEMVDTANTSMSQLTAAMEEISNAGAETSKIVKTIDEIAFQTNLLALNAAVEAARAGEAGAGFAVVADEVRNLAMRAADAAKNTAGLIESTIKKVGDGAELVTKTNGAFSEVADNSKKAGELVAEIAAASNEQAQGIQQVGIAIAEMDKVTQRNAANAEESASASEQMSAQAEQMKTYVGYLEKLVGSRREESQTRRIGFSRAGRKGSPADAAGGRKSLPASTGIVRRSGSKQQE